MGLYKRKNSPYWWWSIKVNSKRCYMSTGVSNKQLAQRIFEKKRDQIIASIKYNIDTKDKTLYELITEYNKHKKDKRSFKRDLLSIRHLKDFYSNISIKQISSKSIREYIINRKNEKVKNATINRELACLRHMLNLAYEWDYLDKTPKIKLLVEDKRQVQILPVEKIDRLVEVANEPIRSMIILVLNTGMRREEVFNLKWQDISFPEKNIYLTKTKSGKMQIIPMNESALYLLMDLPHKSEYLFTSSTGTRYYDIRKMWLYTCKKAGIKDFRFHDLRHNFVSYLIKKGVDPKTIQELARHSSIKTTMEIYAHVMDDHKREAVNRLSFMNKNSNFINKNII